MALVEISDNGGATIKLTDLGNYTLPALQGRPAEEQQAIFLNIPKFRCLEDDIMICTYPKTGTNWVYEIVNMILLRKAERIESNKLSTMLELLPEEDIREAAKSPRVLNTHVSYRYLPEDLKAKQVKTILMVRNPKDTLVSFYNHHYGQNPYGYDGKWENWFPMYMTGKLDFGLYDHYLQEWETAIKNGPGFPLHVIYFEDLKDYGFREVSRLFKFLNVEPDPKLVEDIVKQCEFQKMADEKIPKEVAEFMFKNDFKFFRKGEIGDWKKWFTMKQNEIFENYWNSKMKNSMFQFRYEPVLSKL